MADRLTEAEREAERIAQLRADHADPLAWVTLAKLQVRGWNFPGLSRELNVPPRDAKTPPYYGSPLSSGIACAQGSTAKELAAAALVWEANAMRLKPEFRSREVSPTYQWPDAVTSAL